MEEEKDRLPKNLLRSHLRTENEETDNATDAATAIPTKKDLEYTKPDEEKRGIRSSPFSFVLYIGDDGSGGSATGGAEGFIVKHRKHFFLSRKFLALQ